MNKIPHRLIRLAGVYRRTLHRVYAAHGKPSREVAQGFSTTLHYFSDDPGKSLVIEIEPDLDAAHLRVLAVHFDGAEDGQLVYVRTVDIT